MSGERFDGQLYQQGSKVSLVNRLPITGTITPSQASTATTDSFVTVGIGSTVVLAANASRKVALIVNDSDETIYLSYGGTATLNSGIRLNASGGAIREELYTGAINAISTSGSKILTVTEI